MDTITYESVHALTKSVCFSYRAAAIVIRLEKESTYHPRAEVIHENTGQLAKNLDFAH
jgi:hypothetical protein